MIGYGCHARPQSSGMGMAPTQHPSAGSQKARNQEASAGLHGALHPMNNTLCHSQKFQKVFSRDRPHPCVIGNPYKHAPGTHPNDDTIAATCIVSIGL